MEMNKIMKGTALTALAAATWFAAGTTDAAAKQAENPIDVNDVYVDTYNQIMTVNLDEGQAMEVHVGVGAYSDRNKAVKVSAWDVYEVGAYYDEYDDEEGYGVTNIDLSKLNSTKDNYIAVKTDKSDPIYIKIPAAVKGQKATYNGGNSQVTIERIKQGSSELKDVDRDWEYRTSYGDWHELRLYKYSQNPTTEQWGIDTTKPVKNFEQFQQQGATLYVRSKAIGSGYFDENKVYYNMKPSGTVKDAADKSTDTVEYPLYESGSLPGKESKLTIKKQANGPAVSVDYVNNQVKLPKDVETRMIIGSEYYVADNLADVKENEKVDVDKFFNVSGKRGDVDLSATEIAEAKAATSVVIEVRKKADESKKKSPSKWTIVKVVNPEAWEFKPKNGADFENGVMVTTNQAVEVESITGGSIKIQYQYKNNKTKDYAGKVTVTNAGKFDFQVVIKSSDPAGTDKGVTIKAGDNKSIKASKNDKVYVRKAGNKKDKTFAGKYISVATLNQ